MRLGTYAENRDGLNEVFATAARAVEVAPSKRAAMPKSDLFWVGNLGGGMDGMLRMQDGHELEVRGVQVLVALERFRAERGDYPQTLTELLPSFIDKLPMDPWSGEPFHYVRVDAKKDRVGRSFLLYSVGADGVDDGGVEQAFEIFNSQRSKPGTDFVVNRWDDVFDP